MRMHVAAIAALCLCALIGSEVHAGNYTLTFGSLASQAGNSIASYSDQGFTLTGPFTVVGPRAPSYAGQIGLSSTPPHLTWTITSNTHQVFYGGPGTSGPLSIGIAPISQSTTYELRFTGKIGRITQWTEVISGSIKAGTTQLAPDLPAADSITVENLASLSPYQMLSLNIRTITPQSVPEPSTAAMGVIALFVGAVVARCRARHRAA